MAQPKTLSSTTFEVKPSIEITRSIPDNQRVLVWLNCLWQSGKDSPDRSLIEKALVAAGADYHIVLDRKDFQTELRNPYYTDFLIFGAQLPIEDHISEELREQVYSGKGLLSSMFTREDLNSDVFGMKYNGYLSGSNYVVALSESEISAQEDLQSYGGAIKIDALSPSEGIGWIVETTKQEINRYTGIIGRHHGKGNVLFYAFDLGLTSADYDAFALLLADSYLHTWDRRCRAKLDA